MSLIDDLRSVLNGRSVIVGVGRKESGDDAAGPEVVRLLSAAGVAGTIDAGETPELCTWRIRRARPQAVLFVDAVDFGGDPGEAALLEPGDLRCGGFDTHRAPLAVTMRYLEGELGCICRLLAIQPRSVRQGEDMSHAVRETVRCLSALLAECLARRTAAGPRV